MRGALALALSVSLAMHLAVAAALYGWRTPHAVETEAIDVELIAEQDSAKASDIPSDIATEGAAGSNAEASPSDAVPPSEASDAQTSPTPPRIDEAKTSSNEAGDEPLPDKQETPPQKQPPASTASANQTASLLDQGEADRRRSILRAWLGAVSAELNRRRIYPSIARDKGITGAVRVAFGVDAAGRVSHYEIVASSGHDILDDAVRRMMAKLRTPPPPDGSFETAVTIRFGLR